MTTRKQRAKAALETLAKKVNPNAGKPKWDPPLESSANGRDNGHVPQPVRALIEEKSIPWDRRDEDELDEVSVTAQGLLGLVVDRYHHSVTIKGPGPDRQTPALFTTGRRQDGPRIPFVDVFGKVPRNQTVTFMCLRQAHDPEAYRENREREMSRRNAFGRRVLETIDRNAFPPWHKFQIAHQTVVCGPSESMVGRTWGTINASLGGYNPSLEQFGPMLHAYLLQEPIPPNIRGLEQTPLGDRTLAHAAPNVDFFDDRVELPDYGITLYFFVGMLAPVNFESLANLGTVIWTVRNKKTHGRVNALMVVPVIKGQEPGIDAVRHDLKQQWGMWRQVRNSVGSKNGRDRIYQVWRSSMIGAGRLPQWKTYSLKPDEIRSLCEQLADMTTTVGDRKGYIHIGKVHAGVVTTDYFWDPSRRPALLFVAPTKRGKSTTVNRLAAQYPAHRFVWFAGGYTGKEDSEASVQLVNGYGGTVIPLGYKDADEDPQLSQLELFRLQDDLEAKAREDARSFHAQQIARWQEAGKIVGFPWATLWLTESQCNLVYQDELLRLLRESYHDFMINEDEHIRLLTVIEDVSAFRQEEDHNVWGPRLSNTARSWARRASKNVTAGYNVGFVTILMTQGFDDANWIESGLASKFPGVFTIREDRVTLDEWATPTDRDKLVVNGQIVLDLVTTINIFQDTEEEQLFGRFEDARRLEFSKG